MKLVPPEEMTQGTRPKNLGFEGSTYARGVPEGWQVVFGKSGDSPDNYRFEVDRHEARSGQSSLRIRFSGQLPTKGGSVSQCLRNPPNGRLRLAGYLKTLNATGQGGSLWIRADREGSRRSLAFQNMDGRRVQGTRDWEQHSVEIDVPGSAAQLCFGIFHEGPGSLWADDLSFDGGS